MLKTATIVICVTLLTGCPRQTARPLDSKSEVLAERQRGLLVLELSRAGNRISATDLANGDVRVRRSAVRALARSDDDGTRVSLERSLADEDPEVVSWAAFGLGRICSRDASEATVQHMVARAATLMLATVKDTSGLSNNRLNPWFAFAQAIGRCHTRESERILRSWLTVNGELAQAAAIGLDYYAQSTKALDASTVVALLEGAEKDRNLAVALLAISRLGVLDPLAGRRIVAMAPRIFEAAGDGRRFLLRALPLAGPLALPILERVAIDDARSHALERVEAIRALGQMDAAGQEALARILPRITSAESLTSEAFLLSSKWSIFLELLDQLKEVPKSARAQLARFQFLDASAVKSPALLRRISHLRCRLAGLLSVDDPVAAAIEQCDATSGQREKKFAQLALLERVRIRPRHLALLETLLTDRDSAIVIAALNLVAARIELADAFTWFIAALKSESVGIVATAARLLAVHPQRGKQATQPNAELAATLERAWSHPWPADAIEVRVALIDVLAQFGFLSAKPLILSACSSAVPRIRQHAEQALHQLGEPRQQCPRPVNLAAPKELEHLLTQPATLRFFTDVGPLEIRLDPTLAPIAVTRVVDLAKSHFYDGIEVHRVVPGFVAQLGDRSGDGFGGAGQSPIPCELAPEPFGPLDVGMALSGLDSGSSQFFVTLGPYPQLGGEYSRMGRASAGWEQLSVGDRIEKVELVQ